jgi:hypothetical protein
MDGALMGAGVTQPRWIHACMLLGALEDLFSRRDHFASPFTQVHHKLSETTTQTWQSMPAILPFWGSQWHHCH